MATKKFIIKVKEGQTHCDDCPIEIDGNCSRAEFSRRGLDCDEYDLATMKITEMEEQQ